MGITRKVNFRGSLRETNCAEAATLRRRLRHPVMHNARVSIRWTLAASCHIAVNELSITYDRPESSIAGRLVASPGAENSD
jgi:hypothetical protein